MNPDTQGTRPDHGKYPGRVLIWQHLLAAFLWLGAGPIFAGSAVVQDLQLERAILAEDWEKVFRLLPTEAEPNLPAVSRLIKGHACLATNRNNESLCLFLGASSEIDLRQWEEWSTRFLERYPTDPIACYFRGDAHARHKEWDRAIEHFSKALAIDPNLPLALDARGAARSAKGLWYDAIADLERAIAVKPDFADAYASRGTLNILKRGGAEGAVEWFGRALGVSRDFALALNGRGCARYALGNWDKAKEDFVQAVSRTGCLPISHLNLAALAAAKLDVLAEEAKLLAQDNPGTELSTKIQSLESQIGAHKRGIMGDQAIQTIYGTLRDLNPMGKISTDLSMGTKMQGGPNSSLKTNAELSVKPDWTGVSDFMITRANVDMRNRYGQINGLETQLGGLKQQYSTNPSGVTTNLRRAYVDSGNWPVDTFYGLFYVIEPVTVVPEQRKEAER